MLAATRHLSPNLRSRQHFEQVQSIRESLSETLGTDTVPMVLVANKADIQPPYVPGSLTAVCRLEKPVKRPTVDAPLPPSTGASHNSKARHWLPSGACPSSSAQHCWIQMSPMYLSSSSVTWSVTAGFSPNHRPQRSRAPVLSCEAAPPVCQALSYRKECLSSGVCCDAAQGSC